MTAEEYIAARGGILLTQDSRIEPSGNQSWIYLYEIGGEQWLLGYVGDKGFWMDGPLGDQVPTAMAQEIEGLLVAFTVKEMLS
jgi:hypothetical protein